MSGLLFNLSDLDDESPAWDDEPKEEEEEEESLIWEEEDEFEIVWIDKGRSNPTFFVRFEYDNFSIIPN